MSIRMLRWTDGAHEDELKLGHRPKLVQSQFTNMQIFKEKLLNKISRKHGVDEG